MGSPSQQGRVGKPSVPGDHGDVKQLMHTIPAWGKSPVRREAAGPQSQCLRAGFLQRGARRSCCHSQGTGPQAGAAMGAAKSSKQRGCYVPTPYLFLGHGIDVLAVGAQHQVSQDGAALMGYDILILQRLVLPLGLQVHQDLWGE